MKTLFHTINGIGSKYVYQSPAPSNVLQNNNNHTPQDYKLDAQMKDGSYYIYNKDKDVLEFYNADGVRNNAADISYSQLNKGYFRNAVDNIKQGKAPQEATSENKEVIAEEATQKREDVLEQRMNKVIEDQGVKLDMAGDIKSVDIMVKTVDSTVETVLTDWPILRLFPGEKKVKDFAMRLFLRKHLDTVEEIVKDYTLQTGDNTPESMYLSRKEEGLKDICTYIIKNYKSKEITDLNKNAIIQRP